MQNIVKKILMPMIASIIAMPVAFSQNKALTKATKKEYKNKMKQYAKEGWEIFGTSRTLDVALLMHYEKLDKEGVTEVYGAAVSTSKNIGQEKLLMHTCVMYAAKNGSHIKGRVVEDLGSIVSTEEMEEFEHFYAAYENALETEIKGELRQSYSICRPTKVDGKKAFEFETYYIVDEDEATKARIRAFENAAKESAVAQKYDRQVSEFINEAF